jgi:hypothetical protein
MTVHRNRFLVNKTNICTEFHLYWYYYSTYFGQPFCPSSGVLKPYIGFGTFYAIVINRLLLGVGSKLLVANGSSQLHKMYQSWCTAKKSWWWAERLSETCRVVIPIKLEFSASVGFMHKDFMIYIRHLAFPGTRTQTDAMCSKYDWILSAWTPEILQTRKRWKIIQSSTLDSLFMSYSTTLSIYQPT